MNTLPLCREALSHMSFHFRHMSYKNFAASVVLAFGAAIAPFAFAPQQAEAREVAMEYTCARRGTSFTIDHQNYVLMFHRTGRQVSFSRDYADNFIDVGTWTNDAFGNVTVHLLDGTTQQFAGLLNQDCNSYYG